MDLEQSNLAVVIAYASRKLRDSEKQMSSYSSMKLEFLALHWATTKKMQRLSVWFSICNIDRQQPIKYNSYL